MDRYIPQNNGNKELNNYKIMDVGDKKQTEYNKLLEERLFSDEIKIFDILEFSKKTTKIEKEYQLRDLYSNNKILKKQKKEPRYINTECKEIMTAGNTIDDFYLNTLDWSSKNIIAIARTDEVDTLNVSNKNKKQLMSSNFIEEYITSLSFTQDGCSLGVGTSDLVSVLDVETGKRLRWLDGHYSRVAVLAWNYHLLASANKNGFIMISDVRIKEHLIYKLYSHKKEVCGFKWNEDACHFISGGNDNVINYWSLSVNRRTPIYKITDNCSAVKALAWCPWQSNVFVSGGGTDDGHLRFYNSSNGECINKINTKSQISSVIWSKQNEEVLSSHGHSKHQISVWNYKDLSKIADLTGHESRILNMVMSPNGETIATNSGDDTLRLWDIIDSKKDKKIKKDVEPFMKYLNIR